MKKLILAAVLLSAAVFIFADSAVLNAGAQLLVYEHNSAAGLYAGPEVSGSYRFETDLYDLPVCLFSGVGGSSAFLFDTGAAYNPSSFLLPVYGFVETGGRFGDEIELRCFSGLGAEIYIDSGMAIQSGFSFTLGAGVKKQLIDDLFLYCDTGWAIVLPSGAVHNNLMFSAGAGWRF